MPTTDVSCWNFAYSFCISIIASGTLDDVYSSKDESTSSPYSRSLHISGQRSAASSSYSTNPQLLATNPHPPSASGSRTKLFSKPFAPTSSSDVRLGMEVLVTRSRGQIGRGVVKYVGPIPGRKDMYIGVELGPGQGKQTFVNVNWSNHHALSFSL